jgi:hypothetical protein
MANCSFWECKFEAAKDSCTEYRYCEWHLHVIEFSSEYARRNRMTDRVVDLQNLIIEIQGRQASLVKMHETMRDHIEASLELRRHQESIIALHKEMRSHIETLNTLIYTAAGLANNLGLAEGRRDLPKNFVPEGGWNLPPQRTEAVGVPLDDTQKVVLPRERPVRIGERPVKGVSSSELRTIKDAPFPPETFTIEDVKMAVKKVKDKHRSEKEE